MDTRFWGPSAWKLFHLAAERCNEGCTQVERTQMATFFKTIPYILPCKFCRASLTDYYRAYPFTDSNGILPRGFDLQKWMHTIHNCVNDKLRKQGLYPSPNPPYSKIKAFYRKMARCSWKEQLQTFWDFLFSVAYHHPKEKQLYSKPMPDCPSYARQCVDIEEKNKWNVLPLKERMQPFHTFWQLLPAILPDEVGREWKKIQKKITGEEVLSDSSPVFASRTSMLEWLWKMRCMLEDGYQDPYHSVCKYISQFSSDCSTQKGVFTCRKKRHRAKKTKKHTRS